jgi:hypothetical protein
MTMTEGMIRSGALAADEDRMTLQVHLPWYRSLPISCLESVEVIVDGAPVRLRTVGVPDFVGTIAAAAASDTWWDLRDPLAVSLDAPCDTGCTYALEVVVAVRIPYIQQAPGVPVVQRATVRTELTAR